MKNKETVWKVMLLILAWYVLSVLNCNMAKVEAETFTSGDYKYEVLSDGTVEIKDYTGFAKKLTIPKVIAGNMVTRIGYAAFDYCTSLTNITIPSSVTHIEGQAFSYCTSLTSITIPSSVTHIEDQAFYNCISLTSITIPSSVAYIGDGAFIHCSSLTSIKILTGVTSIGSRAFEGCSSLMSITIPSSVTYIGGGAFYACNRLKYIVVYSTDVGMVHRRVFPDNIIVYAQEGSQTATNFLNAGYVVKPLSEAPVESPTAKGTVLTDKQSKSQLVVTSSVTTNPTVTYKKSTDKNAKTIKVPDKVTLNGVTYKVTAIADNAFEGNKKVTKVVLGKNIKTIGKNAFKGCTKLKTVEVKSTPLNKIGANAFRGCKKLTKITLKTTKLTKKSIGKNALKGTNKKLAIKVPKKMVKKYKTYFKNKGNKKVAVKKG